MTSKDKWETQDILKIVAHDKKLQDKIIDKIREIREEKETIYAFACIVMLCEMSAIILSCRILS